MDSVFLYGSGDPKIAAFLEKLGYAVFNGGGDSALADILRTHADVIVIDGRVVPDMSEVCAFLRSQEPTKEVPIICIAGMLNEEGESEGHEEARPRAGARHP